MTVQSCRLSIPHPGAGVAQLAEQRIRNAQVNGSIPFAGSIITHPDGIDGN